MSINQKVESSLREGCKDFDKGYCQFYKGECFHEDSSTMNHCYRLIPRTDDELMGWMDFLNCSDCNEEICNDCDIYTGYKEEKGD